MFNHVEKYVRETTGISLNTVRYGFKGVSNTKRTLSWTRPGLAMGSVTGRRGPREPLARATTFGC